MLLYGLRKMSKVRAASIEGRNGDRTTAKRVKLTQARWPEIRIDHGVRYGERLVPQVIDERAAKEPNHVFARLARSSDISKGFLQITMKELANAINYTAHWLDEQIGRSDGSETVAYVVSRPSSIRLACSCAPCLFVSLIRESVISDTGFS